jgi:virginiamycin B lyase
LITGAVIAAILLAGCGKTYPVGATVPTPTPAAPSETSSYTVPTSASFPIGITSSSNAIWFTEESGDKIALLDESATFTEFPLPNAGSEPYGITFGPDGNLWFTEYATGANKIGRYDPSTANFAEFAIPTASALATSIVLGSDGALWFTESGTNRIGRATLAGSITDYAVAGTTPLNAAEGSDGSVWFTLNGSNQIGSITPGETVTLYTIPTAASQPFDIVPGSDGALWFTERATGKLGRIATNGSITETTLTGCASPGALRQGVDGDFYVFCTSGSPTVLQYNPQTAAMKSFPLKAGSVPPLAIIAFDNKLYFTDSGLNAIGQFTY